MTSPADRRSRLSDSRLTALLDPAETEFIAHGFDAASLNRILAAANMSKGQAYHYISGKSDLYLAVCERRFEPLLAMAEAWVSTRTVKGDFWQDVQALCGGLAAQLGRDPDLARLARGVYDSAAAAEGLAPLGNRLNQVMDQLVAIGQSEGAIRDDLPNSLIRDALKGAAYSIDKWFALAGPSLDPALLEHVNAGAFEMLQSLVAPASGEGLQGA